VTGVRSVVERYYDAFNARDWDGWAALLDEDVEITIEGETLVGPEAAYAHAAETIRHYPGMRYALERVVAESNDMIVMECRLVNPAGERSADAWKLDGPVCQIYQVSDERIISIRGYYSPSAIDRTRVAEVPSRADATRIAEERAALARVTTLVADGAPPAALFAAVTEEAGRLLRGDLAGMIRFESDETIVAVATWAAAGEHVDVSGRWPLDGDRLATRIRNSGLPVREDAWADVGGPIADFIREQLGVWSSVGSPIIVERRVWGALFIHSTQSAPLPDDTELRLGHFTQLVATVMANVQAHADLRLLVEEQAALRRVAERVARGAPPDEVFATVTEELGKFLMVEGAKMLRYEPHQMATFVASWGPLQAGIPVGRRLSFTGNSVTAQIFETWQPARVVDYVHAKGRLAALLHREGMQSAVGAPIIVEGRLWGALLVGSVQPDPLPPDTEQRIAQFAELVGAAIANLEARSEVERLAEEQAALRRVAELVANESSAERVFAAVAEEVGTLLGVNSSAVLRFDADDTLTVLAAWGEPDMARQIGRRLPTSGDNTAALVLETGRPARMDDQSTATGAIAAIVRELGITSTISCPVIVNGRPWGAIAVNSLQPEPLPPDTEPRVGKFTDLVATAIANVQARADLTASRARIVAASDEARRRIERNLHDGVQQRLISLSLAVRGAQTMLPGAPENPDLRRQLSRVGQGLVDVLDDLRELSRGLHPAILSEAGLDPALRALARRSSVPIWLHLNVAGRLNEPIEVAAYYVVSEALANVAKHAQATSVDIRAETSDHRLDLTIQDNGIGGADPNRGSGLVGLSDRINALGGTIVITSPSGQGTQVRVALPISDS
jgi:signal transduction histidine kinase/ketosteroid isomerase-like protein